MKVINFITPHFIPENTACTNRVLSFINVLENEYKINIITLTQKGIVPEQLELEYSKNTKIYYVLQKDYDGKNFIKRAIKEIYYVLKLVKLSKKIQSNITITTSPSMFIIPIVGFNIKQFKILDIRDIVWEYLDNTTFMSKLIKKVLNIIMIMGMKKFNNIIVTNEYESNILTTKYNINQPIIISNGISADRYDKLSSIKLSKSEKFTVTYIGNVGLAQNLKTLVEAARELSNIQFIIIGDGVELTYLQNYSQKLNLKNIKFLGKLDWKDLEYYYQISSVLYAQLDKNYISAMPSKLYEYASVGLPIIYGGVGQASIFIDKLENAKCIEPNNVSILINTIKDFKKKRDNIISINNKELIINNYIRDIISLKIKNNIKEYLC